MNMQKIMILSLGVLVSSKFSNAAIQQPKLACLRCEFNGSIEFFLEEYFYEKNIVLEQKLEQQYDATTLKDLNPTRYQNGHVRYKFELFSNQCVWLREDTSIKLTLKPNPQIHFVDHGDVYFFNVFNQTLIFRLKQEQFEKFKDFISIQLSYQDHYRRIKLADSSHEWHDDTNEYIISLQPQQAIVYPADLGLNLVLEN